MAVHACLKNEFTEDEKYHNLMTWLNYTMKVLSIRTDRSKWKVQNKIKLLLRKICNDCNSFNIWAAARQQNDLCAQQRLGRCPGWSESSLCAHVIFVVRRLIFGYSLLHFFSLFLTVINSEQFILKFPGYNYFICINQEIFFRNKVSVWHYRYLVCGPQKNR